MDSPYGDKYQTRKITWLWLEKNPIKIKKNSIMENNPIRIAKESNYETSENWQSEYYG